MKEQVNERIADGDGKTPQCNLAACRANERIVLRSSSRAFALHLSNFSLNPAKNKRLHTQAYGRVSYRKQTIGAKANRQFCAENDVNFSTITQSLAASNSKLKTERKPHRLWTLVPYDSIA